MKVKTQYKLHKLIYEPFTRIFWASDFCRLNDTITWLGVLCKLGVAASTISNKTAAGCVLETAFNYIQFHAVTCFVQNPWTHALKFIDVPIIIEEISSKPWASSTAVVIYGAMTDDLNSDLYHGEVSFESKPRVTLGCSVGRVFLEVDGWMNGWCHFPSFHYNPLSNSNLLTCFDIWLSQDSNNPKLPKWPFIESMIQAIAGNVSDPSCWVSWL